MCVCVCVCVCACSYSKQKATHAHAPTHTNMFNSARLLIERLCKHEVVHAATRREVVYLEEQVAQCVSDFSFIM